MANDGTIKIGTELDKSGLSKGLSGLGSFAKKGASVLGSIGKAGITAFGAVGAAGATAFAATTKAALDSVASLEQNIGGVETLFKESADIVIENANRAYKTAGVSANDYMSSVTSFAASLLQSLSGNTDEAAKVADMAMIDMSDNANKMGTSMEAVQNAYQGFAKQNYTMLDNLKLGYGGTKTEMERLLKDAQEISGIEYNLDNLSDVYSAIHVIQEELDITGTTAKEAATTIEGSMNAAKAAWDNLLNGSGTAAEFADAVIVAAENVLDNLGQIIPRLAETIPTAARIIVAALSDNLGQVAELGMQVVSDIFGAIVDSAPRLLDAGMQLIEYLWSGLEAALPQILSMGTQVVQQIWSGMQTMLPQFLAAGMQLIKQLGMGVQDAIPDLISKALPVVAELSGNLRETAGQLVNVGIAFIEKILVGLIRSLPDLIAYVPTIITNVAGIINDNVPKLIAAGAAMILELIVGIAGCIPDLIANFPAIIQSIFSVITAANWVGLGGKIISGIANGVKSLASSAVNALKSVGQNGFKAFQNISWSDLGNGLIKKILSGITSMVTSIPTKLKSIGQTAMQGFKGLSWSSVGSNLISGIVSGIASAAGNLVNAAVNAAKNALETVKGWLGIHSPSRKAKKEIGAPLIAGAAEGVEDEAPSFEQAAVGSAEDAVEAMKKASAADFVARMQAKTYAAAENNEMAACEKYKNNGYDPDSPDDDGEVIIHNQFNVDGKPLVDETVKKTKKEIAREQRSNQAVKGGVAFA